MHGQIGVNSHPGIGSTFWFTARFQKTSSSASPASFLFNEPLENMPLIPNAQILLVEDYPTNREVALAHLKNLGCFVHIAENGKIAVEKFRKNPVDLILMDVQMPEMDGYQATQLIRTLPGGQSVPIIGMTANAFDSDLSNCFKSGMNDVITKPFRKKLFLEKVVHWLSFKDNSPTNQDSSPLGTLSATNTPPLPSGRLPLDWERTLEEFDNDQPFILNLIREFVAHGRKQLQIIQDAIAVQDGTTIYREAHAIKGGAENLNARSLAEAARSLEYLGKNNRLNHPNISEMIETIREELNQLETFTMEICP